MLQQRSKQIFLTVDDDPAIRRLVQRILGTHWTVVEAKDGPEAMEWVCATRAVELMLADVEMPHMSGIELASAARAVRPDLKILYVTGHSEMLFNGRGALCPGEAYLQKPFSPQALVESVVFLMQGQGRGKRPGVWRRTSLARQLMRAAGL